MLRRNNDETAEFRQVELTLWGAAPGGLSPERREALRARIFAQLGEQDPGPGLHLPLAERWVVIPAGVGIAAAIFAAARIAPNPVFGPKEDPLASHATGDVTVDGIASSHASAGQQIYARTSTWLDIGNDVRAGMEPGSSLRYSEKDGALAIAMRAGDVTFANRGEALTVEGGAWVVAMSNGAVVRLAMVGNGVSVELFEGEAAIIIDGQRFALKAGPAQIFMPGAPSDEALPTPPSEVLPRSGGGAPVAQGSPHAGPSQPEVKPQNSGANAGDGQGGQAQPASDDPKAEEPHSTEPKGTPESNGHEVAGNGPHSTPGPRPSSTPTPTKTATPSTTPGTVGGEATQASTPQGSSATPTPPTDTPIPPGKPSATPPGQANTPVAKGGTPPGQANTPVGNSGTPPGQANTAAGNSGTPAGQANAPAGKANSANAASAGQAREPATLGTPPPVVYALATPSAPPTEAPKQTPPGQANSNAGQGNVPPGQANSNAGQGNSNAGQGNVPPGQANSNAGQGNSNAGQGNSNAGQGNEPPGQANSNAGQGNVPPGQANANAGQGNSNAGQGNEPPGQANSNAGQGNTPPGQANTNASQGDTPPGQANSNAGQGNTPPGQANSNAGQGNVPPGQANANAGQGDTPPGQANSNAGQGNGKGNAKKS